MLDINKPVQTRDGRKARIICKDRINTDFSVVVLVDFEGSEVVLAYNHLGESQITEKHSGDLDLINVPEKHVRYINLNEGDVVGGTYKTKEDADEWARDHRVSRIRVELKEGQYDD